MAIIPQTLNSTNLRTTNAKSVNLLTIRNLIEYSLRNFMSHFSEIWSDRLQLHKLGEVSTAFFLNWRKVPQFLKKAQIILPVHRIFHLKCNFKSLKFFSYREFLSCLVDDILIEILLCQEISLEINGNTPIPRNLSCPEKFLVALLY